MCEFRQTFFIKNTIVSEFSAVIDFRNLLTSGNLIKQLICIMLTIWKEHIKTVILSGKWLSCVEN